MTEIRRLDQVERGIEEALRKFTGNGANSGGEAPEITAGERQPNAGPLQAEMIFALGSSTPSGQ